MRMPGRKFGGPRKTELVWWELDTWDITRAWPDLLLIDSWYIRIVRADH